VALAWSLSAYRRGFTVRSTTAVALSARLLGASNKRRRLKLRCRPRISAKAAYSFETKLPPVCPKLMAVGKKAAIKEFLSQADS